MQDCQRQSFTGLPHEDYACSGLVDKPVVSSEQAPCKADVESPWVDTAHDGATSAVAASCASSIASSRQQAGHMLAQLRSLSSYCDTLEVLAAPLRPDPQTGDADVSEDSSWNYDALVQAHDMAIQAASSQLAGLRHSDLSDEALNRAVEKESLARLREWVVDVSADSHGRAPACAAIAGMLEAAVETISTEIGATKSPEVALLSSRSMGSHKHSSHVAEQTRLMPTKMRASHRSRSQCAEEVDMWSALDAMLGG
jgi:hypothetical protein